VGLPDVPTGLLLDAKAHVDDVVRELVLAAATQRSAKSSVATVAGIRPVTLGQVELTANGRDPVMTAISSGRVARYKRNPCPGTSPTGGSG
jgi:hypothetical protein